MHFQSVHINVFEMWKVSTLIFAQCSKSLSDISSVLLLMPAIQTSFFFSVRMLQVSGDGDHFVQVTELTFDMNRNT